MKILKEPFMLAGATLGFSEIGKAVGSIPLQQAGATTSKFIAPAVNINMGGSMIKQLRKLGK